MSVNLTAGLSEEFYCIWRTGWQWPATATASRCAITYVRLRERVLIRPFQ